MAILVVELARSYDQVANALAGSALPLLERALHEAPSDVPAREAESYALWLVGRPYEALAAFQSVLALAPDREESLVGAASLEARLGPTEAAIASWHRALAVNPQMSEYHAQLAVVLAQRRHWQQARSECQEAIRLNPATVPLETRALGILCLLQLGDQDQAHREIETLMALDPPDPDGLRRMFANYLKPDMQRP